MEVEGRLRSVLCTFSGATDWLLGRFRLILGTSSGGGDRDVVEACCVGPAGPLARRLGPGRRRGASLGATVAPGVDLRREMVLDVVGAGTSSSVSFARPLPLLRGGAGALGVSLATSDSLLLRREGPDALVRARLLGRVNVGGVEKRGVGAEASTAS